MVGAGAGGGAAAYGLCRRGRSVLLLDAGPRFDPSTDYPLTGDRLGAARVSAKAGQHGQGHVRAGPETWQRTPARLGKPRSRTADKRRDAADGQLSARSRHRRHHACTSPASRIGIHPAAMKMKTRFGVAADWPLDYGELEPYYVEAEELIGVAGPATQGARWRSRGFPLPPHPLSLCLTNARQGS